MSSSALLNQDFESESEDENFNPAPADDSENGSEGISGNEQEESPPKNDRRSKKILYAGRQDNGEIEAGTKQSPIQNGDIDRHDKNEIGKDGVTISTHLNIPND